MSNEGDLATASTTMRTGRQSLLNHALANALETLPVARRAAFERRYTQSAPRLLDRLESLYGQAPDFTEWFVQLCKELAHVSADRAPELLTLDAQRETTPDWFTTQEIIGYSAYVDRFAGDLRGVIARIPYLRELGVRYLHLLPFLHARAGDNDGGFAIRDFDQVEPRFGTNEDLEALTQALREADISLVSCFVLNHVADDHEWARAAKSGDEEKKRFFHTFSSPSECDGYAAYLDEVFPQTAPGNFTQVPGMGWVWTTFYPYQWDLNYANPRVFGAMVLTLLRLANRGVEVFRLDSVGYLWKRAGTDCKNLPEAHLLIQALRAIADIVAPGVLLKAEAIMPIRDLPPYFGSEDAAGRECHLAYQSSLMTASWAAIAEQSTDLLRRVSADTPPLPAATSWATYVRCHDDIGWGVLRREAQAEGGNADARLSAISNYFAGKTSDSFARGAAFQTNGANDAHGSNGMTAALLGFEIADDEHSRALALRRLQLMYALAFSFGGLPILYTGDELGQGNDYAESAHHDGATDNRWLQRPRFDSSRYADRHDPMTQAGQTFSALRTLSATRARLPALAMNVPRITLDCKATAVFAFLRGNQFIAVYNFSGHPVKTELGNSQISLRGSWRDALHARDAVLVHNDALSIELDPWSFLWLERSA